MENHRDQENKIQSSEVYPASEKYLVHDKGWWEKKILSKWYENN